MNRRTGILGSARRGLARLVGGIGRRALVVEAGLLRIVQSETDRRVTPLDLRMMQRALALAQQSAARDEVPVGAVVYRGEEIIAEGHNLREAGFDPTGHAEMIAIRKAAEKLKEWRLSDCTLAVTLEPCPMCAGAIVQARVGRLVYGATDPKAGAVDTLYNLCTDQRLNHRVDIVRGVLAGQSKQLLTTFFKEKRQRNKDDRNRSAKAG